MPGSEHLTGLYGQGMIADALADVVGPVVRLRMGSSELDGCARVMVASDGWDLRAYPDVRRACAAAGIPWLPVRTELGVAVVGPTEYPGEPGCHECVQRRRRLARPPADEVDAVYAAHTTELAQRRSSWLTPLAAGMIAALVADEQPPTRNAILRVALRDLAVTRHSFLPDPLCPVCGELPDDEPYRLVLASHPKPSSDASRIAPTPNLEALRERYLDPETGLVPQQWSGSHNGVTYATVTVRPRNRAEPILTGGRGTRYPDALAVAVLEALERYAGFEPGGRRTAVRASYRTVADRAIDPRTLGRCPPSPDHLPFAEDRAIPWVWGYSFARGDSILVPEAMAYYGLARPSDPQSNSNGCALGSCLEEAILHGILELAERDAFLVTWFTRMPVPRLDIDSGCDPTVRLHIAAIEAATGHRVAIFDTTLEHGVPSVWAMTFTPETFTPETFSPETYQSAPAPAVVCSAGSALRLDNAVLAALAELGPMHTELVSRLPTELDRAAQLVTDSDKVTRMNDHALLYAMPEAARRLRFLTETQVSRSLADTTHLVGTADLTDDLRQLIQRFLDLGMDVIVVDQTTAEHRESGLRCVKVLIPGLVPMVFGHRERRVHGLPRLLELPYQLGHRPEPLRESELNPYPHPFL